MQFSNGQAKGQWIYVQAAGWAGQKRFAGEPGEGGKGGKIDLTGGG